MEKQPLGARGPDTGRVAPPAAPGQPLPSPRRNPTCRSLHPPRPEAPGTQPEPGEHRIPGTIFGPGGHRPRGPQRSPRASRCSRAPQSPIPVNSTPAALPRSPGRVSGAAPLRARALTPPSRAQKARGSTPLQPLLLLTPPAAHRYLRVANTTDPAAGRTRGGRAGAREGRRLQAGRAEGTPTPPGGGCGGRGPQELAPSGSEWRGRDQGCARPPRVPQLRAVSPFPALTPCNGDPGRLAPPLPCPRTPLARSRRPMS
ncbi:basic proline-rich protein-like [Neophocaena asiaeorientalis asiaeorientalis]|uniref:Basic proline-rich protein-like n=1 Tax=Neophocaena asiaeorientalis asiaeorientalis TaxID=1706337 RepID=A0A341BBQ3_NEOAA|nr:basic proline-rich protein-like [Neophocaena asiaeorientalis asiaeorientalis]